MPAIRTRGLLVKINISFLLPGFAAGVLTSFVIFWQKSDKSFYVLRIPEDELNVCVFLALGITAHMEVRHRTTPDGVAACIYPVKVDSTPYYCPALLIQHRPFLRERFYPVAEYFLDIFFSNQGSIAALFLRGFRWSSRHVLNLIW